ncbi:MAG: secretin and TonB N-terminal domain-containing protein [Candidatus Gastranaerophilales bacterium]|nr:secretin and TonB N-terminal domain-containing protein [Candidatus Gastranaerophilales bacterium]
MQNLIRTYASKACLAVLGLTLLTQTAFALEDSTRMSYLDSVSSSYLYTKPDSGKSILNSSSEEAQGFEASFKLDSKPIITNSDAKIKLSLRNSDVKQVLRMLADKAGINIVLDQSVDGNITLDLNDIEINDAFLIIFKTLQYTYTFEDNTLTVMTLDAYRSMGYTRQNMTVLPIKYVSADSVAEFLNENLFSSNIFGLSNRPIVTSNPRTNQIVIFGTSADVLAIKRVLPVLDTKPVVNSFKVNHTTPKEMANLICDSLFYSQGMGEGGSFGQENNSLDSDEIILGGGVVACRGNSDSMGGGDSNLSAFKSNPLTVTYFPELGRISTVGGSVEQVEVIRDFIKENDKKQLMAYVELSVIELNETGSKEFSNEWNLWTPFISLGFTPSDGLTTSSVSPFFVWGDKYPTQVVNKSYDDNNNPVESSGIDYIHKTNNKALTYKLKYLVENGNGRVLTNPKIMVTNGRKATIDMTSDYVKSVTSQILQGSDTVTSATQKTYDIGSDEGLLIEIVPFISPDGYVSMNISPEFATIKERVYSANDNGNQELSATLLQRRDL